MINWVREKQSSCARGLSMCLKYGVKTIWAKDWATSATFPRPAEQWWETVQNLLSTAVPDSSYLHGFCVNMRLVHRDVSLTISMVFINRIKDMWTATGKQPELSPITFFTVILNMTSRRPVCFAIKGKGSNPRQFCADASSSAGVKASAWRH